jgi:hypothetical protein
MAFPSMGPWLYFVRVLHGLSQAVLFSAFFAFAANTIPESRCTEGLGWFGISGIVPIGMGPGARFENRRCSRGVERAV